jgi:hypothetical protein
MSKAVGYLNGKLLKLTNHVKLFSTCFKVYKVIRLVARKQLTFTFFKIIINLAGPLYLTEMKCQCDIIFITAALRHVTLR